MCTEPLTPEPFSAERLALYSRTLSDLRETCSDTHMPNAFAPLAFVPYLAVKASAPSVDSSAAQACAALRVAVTRTFSAVLTLAVTQRDVRHVDCAARRALCAVCVNCETHAP